MMYNPSVCAQCLVKRPLNKSAFPQMQSFISCSVLNINNLFFFFFYLVLIPIGCSTSPPQQKLINHSTMVVNYSSAFLHTDIAQKPYIFTIPYNLVFWLTVSFCLNH